MEKSEAFEVIKELVGKFIDVDQAHLTSYDRAEVMCLLDAFESVIDNFKE